MVALGEVGSSEGENFGALLRVTGGEASEGKKVDGEEDRVY